MCSAWFQAIWCSWTDFAIALILCYFRRAGSFVIRGPEFKSSATSDFLRLWGVKHRISSSYNPQSNGRAEVAVKKVKRFLILCIGPSGSLDNDKFLRGMLQLRNSPDRDCNLSPAQIVFGRPLRDAFSFVNCRLKFDNPAVHPMWREAWMSKEDALKHRFVRSVEGLNCTHSPAEAVEAWR